MFKLFMFLSAENKTAISMFNCIFYFFAFSQTARMPLAQQNTVVAVAIYFTFLIGWQNTNT